MHLEFLAKDANSRTDYCPSVYFAEDGSLVIQGNVVDADTRGNLTNVLPGEGAVHIDLDTVKRALTAKGLL